MQITNFEFKAYAKDLDELERKLLILNPEFIGEDHQTDTYFDVPNGRLKIREGDIENALIYYEREDLADSKRSEVIIFRYPEQQSLKEILTKTLQLKTIVSKKRRIYFIGNVKIHFDRLEGLGEFVEVEAIDQDGRRSLEDLKRQCDYFSSYFLLEKKDYISKSYCDLITNNYTG